MWQLVWPSESLLALPLQWLLQSRAVEPHAQAALRLVLAEPCSSLLVARSAPL